MCVDQTNQPNQPNQPNHYANNKAGKFITLCISMRKSTCFEPD